MVMMVIMYTFATKYYLRIYQIERINRKYLILESTANQILVLIKKKQQDY